MRQAVVFGSVLVAALAVVSAAAGGGGATFTDPTEGTAGSADIQTVSVANNPSSRSVTFSVQISNMPSIKDDHAAIEIYIDADNNRTTGGQGVECILGLASDGWYFLNWDGKAFTDMGATLYPVTYDNGLLSMTMDQGSCNLSRTFEFEVSSYRGPDAQSQVEDDAPDTGAYTYTLSTVALSVKQQALSVNGAPRSGQTFMVTGYEILFSDDTVARVVGVNCSATLSGHKLKGSGIGGCSFAIPKKSHGKKLVVTAAGKVTSGKRYRMTSTYVVR